MPGTVELIKEEVDRVTIKAELATETKLPGLYEIKPESLKIPQGHLVHLQKR